MFLLLYECFKPVIVGMSDSKSPQISSTFLTILTVLNNTVFWMISARPSISKSSRLFTKFSGLFRAHQLEFVSPSPSSSIAFLVIWQCLSTNPSFPFLWFSLFGPSGRQCPLFGRFSHFFFFFFVDYQYHYFYYFTLLRVFHGSVGWWNFTGGWVTACFFKSPTHFSMF